MPAEGEEEENMNITASIYNDDDQEIKVIGEYTPPCRGYRDHYGAQMEPDEPDSVEDVSATIDGVEYELKDVEIDRAIMALWEAVGEIGSNE